MTSEEARELLQVAAILHAASGTLVGTLQRLCDQQLSDSERDDSTGQLYADLAGVRSAMTGFADAVLSPEQAGPGVLWIDPARHRELGADRSGG
jgi:hypothetical protein